MAGLPIAVERDGYKFYFYSNEHQPIHVHDKIGSDRAEFDVSDGVELVESKGMKSPRALSRTGNRRRSGRCYREEMA